MEERGYAIAMHEAATRETAARKSVARTATSRAAAQARLRQPGVNAPTGGALVSGSNRVSLAKDAKLDIRVFTGKELHKGLGGGFKNCGRAFREELEMAQEACGYAWPEKYKFSKLDACFRGEAKAFFH